MSTTGLSWVSFSHKPISIAKLEDVKEQYRLSLAFERNEIAQTREKIAKIKELVEEREVELEQ